jgi:hypothetical protein
MSVHAAIIRLSADLSLKIVFFAIFPINLIIFSLVSFKFAIRVATFEFTSVFTSVISVLR